MSLLFVTLLDGKTVTLSEVTEDTEVSALKDMLGSKLGLPAHQLIVVWAGKCLNSSDTLKECNYSLKENKGLHCLYRTDSERLKTSILHQRKTIYWKVEEGYDVEKDIEDLHRWRVVLKSELRQKALVFRKRTLKQNAFCRWQDAWEEMKQTQVLAERLFHLLNQ